jgi:hypothetical protein
MFQRLIPLAAAAVVTACATGPSARDLATQCASKYREGSPPGVTPAKATSALRPSYGALRDYPSSYACVAVFVNERGEVTDAKLLETNTPQVGDYFLKLTSQAKYTPRTLNGNPIATRAIISLGID